MGRLLYNEGGSKDSVIKSIQRVSTHTNGVTTISAVDISKTIVVTTPYGGIGRIPMYLSSSTTLQRYQQSGGASGIGESSRVEVIEYK